ncbi:hypothetical protein AVEN_44797-1 [Araneus ventricosus]|uniref:Uncharacterized protein n=1 Tax=Araneus ventricosus TaxID=182803 RepID=A0A4Y2K1A1_ARAVE|nr:hypothetical protein AVEN_44797-1 [Araneus ventricosus]
MLQKRLQSKEKASERTQNVQLQDNEENTPNRLSPSVMGQISNSSNLSNEYEDKHKQRETKTTIISQDSPSTSQMRTTFSNVAQAGGRTGVSNRSAVIIIDMEIINKTILLK